MAKNTSILLGDYFESFINEEISSGRFSSASEVVRTALRLLELEEHKIKKFRDEIEIGEKVGWFQILILKRIWPIFIKNICEK
jgi:antitoxin ParD1/3/4